MRTYQLYLKEDKAWVWVGTIDAPTHAEAFRLALLSLRPGDEDLAIRLEQDTSGDYKADRAARANAIGNAGWEG